LIGTAVGRRDASDALAEASIAERAFDRALGVTEAFDTAADIGIATMAVRVPGAVLALAAFDAQLHGAVANGPGGGTNVVVIDARVEARLRRVVAALVCLAVRSLKALDADVLVEFAPRVRVGAVVVPATRDASAGLGVAVEVGGRALSIHRATLHCRVIIGGRRRLVSAVARKTRRFGIEVKAAVARRSDAERESEGDDNRPFHGFSTTSAAASSRPKPLG
jgi:hypothetical protein